MAFDHLTLVTVAGRNALTVDGAPVTGRVTFTAPGKLVDLVSGQAVFPVPIIAAFDATGSFTVQLPATDDPDMAPTGWVYDVELVIAGSHNANFQMAVPVATVGTLDFFLAAPTEGSAGVYVPRGPKGDQGIPGVVDYGLVVALAVAL